MKGDTFDRLPPEIRKGIKVFYGSYDAEVPENILWQWTIMPLHALAEEVWKDPELNQAYPSFRSYHRWYTQDHSWPPKWTKRDPDSVYPIILTGPPEGPYDPEKGVIDDGWHRFHWYIDRWGPRKMIPVVWPVGWKRK